ncbi:MAG: glycosyltransferase family 2 protein [Acutalibacteraceae bacterium]
MNKPFISVVMPVYGVEPYLHRAAESILKQTFRELELILVDDCSPDRCGEICEEIAKNDSRVKVLHLKKNGGLSNARNQGMTLAAGKYILFMDSDDYLDLDALQLAVDSIHKNPAKLVIWGLIEEYYDNANRLSASVKVDYPEHLFSSKEELRPHIIRLEEKTLLGYQWNKLYDFDYLREKQLKYEQVALIEDILFSISFVEDIDSLNILNITPYHYQKKVNYGLTSKFVADYYDLHMFRISKMLELYKSWGLCIEEVKRILANIYVRYVTSAIQRNCDKRSGMDVKEQKQFIKNLFDTYLYQELIGYVSPESKIVKKLSVCLQDKNVNSCYMYGKGIYFVKNKLPILFAKLKRNR